MRSRGALLTFVILVLAACDPTASGPASAPPSSGPASAPPSLATTPAGPTCPGAVAVDEFIQLSSGTPSVDAAGDLCIVDFILFLPGVATGDAVVSLDGTPILTVDLANYETTGSEGAGSGERVVTPGAPIPVGNGSTLSLDLGGCSGCGSFLVTVEADSL